MWVKRGRGADDSFKNESFGSFSEVRYHVRDVTLIDVVLCGVVKDLEEQRLTRAARAKDSPASRVYES